MTTTFRRPLPVRRRAFDVADTALAAEGVRRIEWAEREMPVLRLIRERFEKEQPLEGMRIGACLHVTSETANLMRTLEAGGAKVALCASNPLVDAGRRRRGPGRPNTGSPTFARRGVDRDGYYGHLNAVADTHPQMTMDDGCDLVSLLHKERRDRPGRRHRRHRRDDHRRHPPARDGRRWRAAYPVIAVNEAQTKHFFDNRYGTGQSTVDGILRATNILIAGRHVVVAGYGWVGQGIASRMRGMGAHGRHRRGRPRACHRGAHGRLPGQAGRGSRAVGRAVRHRHGQCQRLPPRALRADGRRRDHGQQRPLRRRARARRVGRDGGRPMPPGPARRARSTTWVRRSFTCSPRAGWSTWPPPKATRRRSWT